jgi:cytochrome c556
MKPSILFMPVFLVLTACADSIPHTVANTGSSDPALHAVRDKQLHELMSRMKSLMQERYMTEPELDAEHRKYAQKVAKTAQSMSQTLDAILVSSTSLKLSKTEESTFQALAEKLRKQTQELQKQGEQNRMDLISDTLEQINTTCNSCHVLFRKL